MDGKPLLQNPSISQLTSQLDPIPSVTRRLRRAKFQPHHGRHPAPTGGSVRRKRGGYDAVGPGAGPVRELAETASGTQRYRTCVAPKLLQGESVESDQRALLWLPLAVALQEQRPDNSVLVLVGGERGMPARHSIERAHARGQRRRLRRRSPDWTGWKVLV
jgi:hypothetical protein